MLNYKTEVGKYEKIKDSQPSPQNRQKVYFCCHPDDFDKYFDVVTNEILEKQPHIAIYFYSDNDFYNEEERFLDLNQMIMFVIPVTRKFITDDDIPARKDFDFARCNGIPLLLLQQDYEIENIFNKKIGDYQMLCKWYSERKSAFYDPTALTYDNKLTRFLDSVIIGDKLSEEIRQAFDAYIFLSYRKKDRKYAQELMKLIHSNKFCRDIAIWYDEHLVPGENFNEAIKEAIDKSGLFTMVVTPNLINEINYVRTHEYPMAQDLGKLIFPVESENTDKKELKRQYTGIPDVTNIGDGFSDKLLNVIQKIALKKNKKDPKHNYLMGLAYLNGIDVEVNRDRAVELIWDAAQSGLPTAIRKISDLLVCGDFPDLQNKVDSNGFFLPNRPVFLRTSPPDYVTFNSFYDERQSEDERRFIEIADIGVNPSLDYLDAHPETCFYHEMEIIPGRTYAVRIKINNNANPELNFAKGSPGLAMDVNIHTSFSYAVHPQNGGYISADISSFNANPRSVFSTVKLTTKSKGRVDLRFVPASVKMHGCGKLNNQMLPARCTPIKEHGLSVQMDKGFIFGDEGLYIGVHKLNGYIPGGDMFSEYITYFLRATQIACRITKTLSVDGINFYKEISVTPKDIITFKIVFENIGSADITNVTCHSVLPECLELLPNTTVLTDICNPKGVRMVDTIAKNGFNIGLYGPNTRAVIVFKTKISDDFSRSDNEMRCSKYECKSYIDHDFGEIKDGVTFYIEK